MTQKVFYCTVDCPTVLVSGENTEIKRQTVFFCRQHHHAVRIFANHRLIEFHLCHDYSIGIASKTVSKNLFCIWTKNVFGNGVGKLNGAGVLPFLLQCVGHECEYVGRGILNDHAPFICHSFLTNRHSIYIIRWSLKFVVGAFPHVEYVGIYFIWSINNAESFRTFPFHKALLFKYTCQLCERKVSAINLVFRLAETCNCACNYGKW